jgi:outer membrane protein assembly factor BamA
MENITTLPKQIDVNNTTYGIGLKAEKLDYKYNPTKGYEARIEGGAGTRQIIKNAKLPEKIYENIKPTTLQINSTASVAYYVPLLKQATIKLAAKGAYRYTDQLFKNELFRIGGLRTLRGFDEESINASNYTIGTIEFRYLLEQNSYTYLFFDGGYYENNSIEGFQSDFPFGFGAGISFETKAGIFSLNYALGYQQRELAPLRSAKIHFGFVNFF